MRQFIPILLLVSASFQVLGQKAPIKFGKIELSDMEMTVYPNDTSAPAVILCDYGFFNAETFNFTQLTRIKILKKEGSQYANRLYNTDSKAYVKGATYNLVNGEIVKTKLENSGIFVERATDYDNKVRVTMPDVKVGSVIEIEATYPGFPFVWNFQDHIPVMWSELVLENSPYVQFQKNFYGQEQLYINENIRWVGKDMPAVKEEPYISSFNNCITKFEFDIYEISIPGRFVKKYAKSWESVSMVLYDATYFGGPLMSTMFLNDWAKEIRNSPASDMQKVGMAFDRVKGIQWNDEESLTTSETELSVIYKRKTGNSADINLILYSLLKKLDFDVYPVVMSTRENGVLSPIYPSINKLNYVIVLVKLDGQNILLDATEKNLPVNMLPFRALNYQGRAVETENSFWVDLEPVKRVKKTSLYDLTLDEEMNFSGKINYSRSDYAGYNFRKEYQAFNSENEYLEDFCSDKPGLKVNSFIVNNLDSLLLPVKDEYQVEIDGRTDVIGDEVYVYPMFYEGFEENPFNVEDRRYPVDFGYGYEWTNIAHIRLPEGVSVQAVPKPCNVKMPDNAGSFSYQVSVTGSDIQVVCKFNLTKTFYNLEEYPGLQVFFDEVVKKRSEPVILKIG